LEAALEAALVVAWEPAVHALPASTAEVRIAVVTSRRS